MSPRNLPTLLTSLAILATSFLTTFTTALEVGDCICREGVIMDRFCINRKTLLDKSSVKTLEGPEQHSMHCLLDVGICIDSGFTVLTDPVEGETEYTVGAQFDEDGTKMVYDFAAERGKRNTCYDCTGEKGDVVKGFRAAVVGVVTDVGDSSSSDPLKQAPSIEVTGVMESSGGCASFTCPGVENETVEEDGDEDDENDDEDNAEDMATATPNVVSSNTPTVDCNEVQSTILLSETPLVKLQYVVNVPNTQTNREFTPAEEAAGGVLTAKLTYEDEGYVALAFSEDNFMPNSEAVICLPDDTNPTVSKYFLGDRNPNAITAVSAQTLTNATVTQADGITTCTFTKLLSEENEIGINPNGPNKFLWSVGRANELSYHRARGIVNVDLAQCAVPALPSNRRRRLRRNKNSRE